MLGTRIPGSFTRPPLHSWAAAALLMAWSSICATADRAPAPREASSSALRNASRGTAPGAHRPGVSASERAASKHPSRHATTSLPASGNRSALTDPPPSDPVAALEVWPDFPPGIDRAPAGAGGMLAAIDPETGRLTRPTPEQVQRLSREAAPSLSQRCDDLPVFRLPDGALMVHLEGRFQQYVVARVDRAGKVHLDCVESPDLERATAAPAAKPVEE